MAWTRVKVMAVACTIAGAAGCGGSDSASDPSGRSFTAVSVVAVGGAKLSIADVEGIRVGFSEQGDGVGWTAGCNEMGATSEIRRSRIEVDHLYGTEVACDSGVMQAEDWFTEFLSEDPKWRLDGSMLTLSTDRAVVELEPVEDSG